MKRNWELEELVDNFILLPHELQLIGNKTAENRLGFGVLFKFFQHEARFPNNKNEVPKSVIQSSPNNWMYLLSYLTNMT